MSIIKVESIYQTGSIYKRFRYTAEALETEAQLELLRSLGCDHGHANPVLVGTTLIWFDQPTNQRRGGSVIGVGVVKSMVASGTRVGGFPPVSGGGGVASPGAVGLTSPRTRSSSKWLISTHSLTSSVSDGYT